MLYNHVHFNISEEVVETVCIAFHIFLIVENIVKGSEAICSVLLLTVLE